MIENKKANEPIDRKVISAKDFDNKYVKPYDKDDVKRFISTLITKAVVKAYNDKVHDSRKFRELTAAKIGFRFGINALDNAKAGANIDFVVWVEDIFGNLSWIPGFGCFVFYQIGNDLIDVEILQDGKAIMFGKTWAEYSGESEDESEDEQEHGN